MLLEVVSLKWSRPTVTLAVWSRVRSTLWNMNQDFRVNYFQNPFKVIKATRRVTWQDGMVSCSYRSVTVRFLSFDSEIQLWLHRSGGKNSQLVWTLRRTWRTLDLHFVGHDRWPGISLNESRLQTGIPLLHNVPCKTLVSPGNDSFSGRQRHHLHWKSWTPCLHPLYSKAWPWNQNSSGER